LQPTSGGFQMFSQGIHPLALGDSLSTNKTCVLFHQPGLRLRRSAAFAARNQDQRVEQQTTRLLVIRYGHDGRQHSSRRAAPPPEPDRLFVGGGTLVGAVVCELVSALLLNL